MAKICRLDGVYAASLVSNQAVAAESLYSRSQPRPLDEERSRPV